METESHVHVGGHTVGYKGYVLVWVALMILTVITYYAATINFGVFNIVIALGIASLKAALVALFFMHLKFEDRVTWIFVIYPLILLGLLISSTVLDAYFYLGLSPKPAIP